MDRNGNTAAIVVRDLRRRFGTQQVLDGVNLDCPSGQITTINGSLTLNGTNARVADAADTSTNSALVGLTKVSGDFFLQNGATVGATMP